MPSPKNLARFSRLVMVACLYRAGPIHADPLRTALVIGNAGYAVAPLKNPVADARSVGDVLKSLGFQVTQLENASQAQMQTASRDWLLASRNAQVRLLYFAGHGVQIKGRNYLLPVDIRSLYPPDEISSNATDLSSLIERLALFDQGVNLVVLDACRKALPGTRGPIGSLPSGLASQPAPNGTLVAYSTAPGALAQDGQDSTGSVYTRNLVQLMKTPGLPVEDLFKLVRIAVVQQTQRKQVPWESSSLMGEFCLSQSRSHVCGQYNSTDLVRPSSAVLAR